MSIRVIAGTAKGKRLKLVPGDTTRPVMDRVKEALFSIIGSQIIEARFLDLFAGTGSVGIEALSRGAEHAVFVEKDRFAYQTIVDNLAFTNLTTQATVHRADVFQFLQMPPADPFDFIYIAPPQYHHLWLETLKRLDDTPTWISPTTTLIVQIDPGEYTDYTFKYIEPFDDRRYGNTLLLFYQSQQVIGKTTDE